MFLHRQTDGWTNGAEDNQYRGKFLQLMGYINWLKVYWHDIHFRKRWLTIKCYAACLTDLDQNRTTNI